MLEAITPYVQMEFIGLNESNLNISDIIVNSSVDMSSGSIPVEESPKNLGNNKQAQFVSENGLLPADDQMEFIGVNEFNLNINDIIVNSSVDTCSSLIPVKESPTNLGDTEQAQLVSENVLPLADEDGADDDSSNYEPTYSEEERMEDKLMDEMGEDAPEDNILIRDAQIATNDGNVINHIREVPGKRKRSKRGKAKRNHGLK